MLNRVVSVEREFDGSFEISDKVTIFNKIISIGFDCTRTDGRTFTTILLDSQRRTVYKDFFERRIDAEKDFIKLINKTYEEAIHKQLNETIHPLTNSRKDDKNEQYCR